MKSISTKEKAINYRKKGYSYNMISEKLGLSKSTLSNWLKDIPYKPNKKALLRVSLGQLKSALFKQKQKRKSIAEMKDLARKDLGKLTKRDLWMLGIGLYLGEGSKIYENIRVINSDPDIIILTIRWFQDICNLKKKNFKPSVHIYPDNNEKDTINYWSKITGIPKKQFCKTQIDQRNNKSKKKKRKLPYGTLHLQVKSCGEEKFGKNLHRRIMGWIEVVINQTKMRE